RVRRLCPAGSGQQPGGRGRVLADGVLRPRLDVAADRGLGTALSLRRGGRAGLFSGAGDPRAERLAGGDRVRGGPRDDASAPGGLRAGAGAQDGDLVAPARLRQRGGSVVGPRWRVTASIGADARPRLAGGGRLRVGGGTGRFLVLRPE